MIGRTVVRIKQVLIGGCLALVANTVAAAQWPVRDANLQVCLTELAQKHGWKQPAEFQSIQCHNRSIASLEGIDAFSQITSLSLYNNSIQTAQLRGFARLQQLNLARNELVQMELSELPALGKLYFFDNRLAALTLPALPALEELKGNGNGLKSFTYSTLPRLKKVYLFNNQLPTIDIHQMPALEYMDVRENPMPDELYEEMDAKRGVTFLHDGNAEDW